jgi:hypothetical protein
MSHEGPITDGEYQDFGFLWEHLGMGEDGETGPAAEMAALSDEELRQESQTNLLTRIDLEKRERGLTVELIRRANIKSIALRKLGDPR